MASGIFDSWTVSTEANSKLNLALKMEEKGMSNERIDIQLNKAEAAEAEALAKQ